MAGQMQMCFGSVPNDRELRLVTRFERLSRRISLAGLLSNHQAAEAISQGAAAGASL